MGAAARVRTDAQAWGRKVAVFCGVSAYAVLHAPASTEPAIANGDTRSLTFINKRTNESASFTYKVNGYYDADALEKLNWFMRDWRINEQTKMDPRLFDILWEVYSQSGSTQPIDVLSAYRSPQTNSMLHRRSRLVAEHSQHMQGKAIDAHFIDVGPGPIRDIAMRMQEGGVGFYPIGSTPWVHVDSGTVRYWPRMSRNALARLFPDGKTVFIPADGQPMDGYAEAKAMIESRGGEVQTASSSGGGLFSWLFGGARGGGADDDEESGARAIVGGRGGASVAVAAIGRGGAAPAISSAEAPPPAPEPVRSPDPAPPPAAPAAPTPEAVADASPDVKDVALASADVTEEPTQEAPLPPRKPNELFASLDFAPLPPRRPSELSIATTPTEGAPSNADLIATLIEGDALPNAIAKGVKAAPKSALALSEPTPNDKGNRDALIRAAALAAPPFPPPRPRLAADGVTKAERSAPTPPQKPTKAGRPTAANPFGSLVIDAFNAPASPPSLGSLGDLRGPSP